MSTEMTSGDEQLLARARTGDPEARQLLLARHRPLLKSRVRSRFDRRLADRLDPSDVVQDALVDAVHGLSGYFRRPLLPFGAWLFQLARDRLIDLRRRHIRATRRSTTLERRRGAEGPDSAWVDPRSIDPVEVATSAEAAAALRVALDRLPPRDRQVLSLRYLEHRSTTEVGEILGIGPGVVRVRHFRALGRLRDVLMKGGEG